MELETNDILAAVITALAGFAEPNGATQFQINEQAPVDHRPVRMVVSDRSVDMHPTEFDGIEIVDTGIGQPGLSMDFDARVSIWLAEATAIHTGETMTLSVCGDVVLSPVILEAIHGGQVMLSGQFEMDLLNAIASTAAGHVSCEGEVWMTAPVSRTPARSGSRGQ